MQRRLLSSAPFLLLAGCSALVQIDDDKYLNVTSGDSGGGDNLGGDANGDGDDTQSGGASGAGAGGTGAGGTGADSGGGSGGNSGGTGGTPVILPAPKHYWPLDNSDPADEGSPPFSANFTHGDGWRPTSGVSGGAYEVLGALQNQYLSLNATVGETSPSTTMWWFSSLTDEFIVLASKTHFGVPDAKGWAILADTSGLYLRIGAGTGDNEVYVSVDLPGPSEGKWTHIALGIDQNFSASQDRLKLWVNGAPVVDETRAFTGNAVNPQAETRFGYQEGASAPAQQFAGFVDEIRVYDEMLSDEQVRALYEMNAP